MSQNNRLRIVTNLLPSSTYDRVPRLHQRKRKQTLRRVAGATRRVCSSQSAYRACAAGAGEFLEGQGRLLRRIDFGPGYRIYFGKDGDHLVILIGGGTKKRQEQDIFAAQECTHDVKETIRARAQRDPDFRQALLRESVECIINGDLETGKSVLRDFVNATAGFQEPGMPTQLPVKARCKKRKASTSRCP